MNMAVGGGYPPLLETTVGVLRFQGVWIMRAVRAY